MIKSVALDNTLIFKEFDLGIKAESRKQLSIPLVKETGIKKRKNPNELAI